MQESKFKTIKVSKIKNKLNKLLKMKLILLELKDFNKSSWTNIKKNCKLEGQKFEKHTSEHTGGIATIVLFANKINI